MISHSTSALSDYLQCSSLFPSCLFFPSFLSTVLSCTYAYTQIFFSPAFSHGLLLTFLNSISLYIPHPAVIHIVYSSLKTHPVSCKLLAPPLILSPSPFPSLFCLPPCPECLDRSKWCDCDCSAGRLPFHVCLSASLESLTWAEGEEEGKRLREREREGKVLLNNKAWRPSREPSLASGVSLSSSLSLFLYLCLSALSLYSSLSPTLSFLDNLFPAEHPICNSLSTISHFESTLLLLFLPLKLALYTLTCSLSLLV